MLESTLSLRQQWEGWVEGDETGVGNAEWGVNGGGSDDGDR